MKCPKCGFNSFDFLDFCKKCSSPLNPTSEHKSVYKNIPHAALGTDLYSVENSSTADNNIYTDINNSEDGAQSGAAGNNISLSIVESEIHLESSNISNVTEKPHNSTPNEINNDYSDTSRIESPDPALFADNSEELVINKRYRARYIPPEEESITYNLAGFISRAVAFLIDMIIVSTLALITVGIGVYLTNGITSDTSDLLNVLVPLYFLLFFLASTYFIFLQGFTGTTIGKMLLGLKLINYNGNTIGFWEAFVRWIGYYVSAVFLFVGFIWSLFDSNSQTWHDKIAGTYVVKD